MYGFAVLAIIFAAAYIFAPASRPLIHSAGCYMSFCDRRADTLSFSVVISGSRRDHARVDVFAPGHGEPESVWQSKHQKFIDSDEIYFGQFYRWIANRPVGRYRIAATLDGSIFTEIRHFDIAEWIINVRCN